MSVLVMAAVAVALVVVDIHDCLYVCIGDGGGPARSSSIRTRATVAQVTGAAFHFPHVGSAEFVDSLGSAPDAYHRRFHQRQRTTMLLLFVLNPT